MSDVHSGHRQRLKERFKITGFAGFAPHEALELILFYAIPRRDTNAIAHELVETYGGFDKVLDADIESLSRIKGMGEGSAILLKLFVEAFKLYTRSKREQSFVALTALETRNYCSSLFVGETEEKLYLLCLDANGKLITVAKVSEGTVTSTEAPAHKVAELATRHRAVSVILTHNHPNGVAMPSTADLVMTKKLLKVLHDIEIRLNDHVIVAENRSLSLAECGAIYSIREELHINV